MKRNKKHSVGPIVVMAWLALTHGVPAAAIAGDLNPPPGLVTPTMKPLSQVEPRTPVQDLSGDGSALFVIVRPGSYYLTGNIDGEVGKDGIRIESDDVTLDLNGFTLVGVPGSLSGVFCPSPDKKNITIVNGIIRDWGNDGVWISSSRGNVLRDLQVHANGGDGIQCGNASTIVGCVATNNTGVGIAPASHSVVIGCIARDNVRGFHLTNDTVIRDCTATRNTTHGIVAQSGVIVYGNTCTNNGQGGVGAGILVESSWSGIRIEGNNVYGNDFGIDVDGTGNIILKNTASANATSNYDIASGNAYGPIVPVAGVGDISTTPNADHPWANFAY